MDHRTKNNFQIASSVLRLQATRSGNAEVSDALKRAANRILSIAATHDNLAHSSTSLSYLNISRYLSVLCQRIMESLTDDAVLNLELEERSEEHTSELQSLMRISYAVFCLKKKNKKENQNDKT